MEFKTDVAGIYRTEKGYLINKDNDGLAAYKKQKAAARKVNDIEKELVSIRSDISEIKELLKGLVR